MRAAWRPGIHIAGGHETGPPRLAGRVAARSSSLGARGQELLEAHFAWVTAIIVVGVAANQVIAFGLALRQWDWMAISGTATLLLGLALAQSFRPTFEETVKRLRFSGTIRDPNPAELDTWFETRLDRWSHRTGLAIAATAGLAFVLAYGLMGLLEHSGIAVFTIVSMLGGYVVGRYVGQALLFGRLHTACEQTCAELVLQPGHLDGAAGWRPLGQLYFRHALLLALPAAHLGLWWLLIPAFEQYWEWRDPYAWLLVVVVLWEVAAFLGPMWAFHQEMGRQKGALLHKADEAGREVARLKAELAVEKDAKARALLNERLEVLNDWYATLEHLPTWPVDRATRRKFTVNQAVLAVPMVASWLNETAIPWSDLGAWFE